MNALNEDDRERWMMAIADRVQKLKDDLVVLPKRQGTRWVGGGHVIVRRTKMERHVKRTGLMTSAAEASTQRFYAP